MKHRKLKKKLRRKLLEERRVTTDEYPDLPSVQSPDAADTTEMTAEEIRRSHFEYEALAKSIGLFYILAGLIITITGGLVASIAFVNEESSLSAQIFVPFLVGSVGAFLFVVGVGLRGLKPWVQTPALVLSVLQLPAFPLTLISCSMSRLLFCDKGIDVFSPEYKKIMAKTPDIKHSTDPALWFFLALLIVLIGMVLIVVFVSSP
jgi:hypothetical protein